MSDEKMQLAVPLVSNDALDDLILSGDPTFLKRISLAQGLSDTVAKHKVAAAGDFCYGNPNERETFRNLGPKFLCVVGPARAHALTMHDKKVTEESFDVTDPVFIKIRNKADSRSTPKGKGKPAYMYGTDWLVYVPAVQAFAVLPFMKTSRRNAKPMSAENGRIVEIYSHFIDKENSWYVTKVNVLPVQPELPVIDGKLHNQSLLAFKVGGGSGEEEGEAEEASDEQPADTSGRRPR